MLRRDENGLGVDGEQQVEGLACRGREGFRRLRQSGVVDEDVETAEAIDRRRDHQPYVGFVGHVGADEQRGGVADGPGRLLAAGCVAIDDDHASAFSRETTADCGAEA